MHEIETYFHAGPGYEPFLIREGWQVAQLNYMPELSATNMRRVERHKATDEVFVLVRGRSVLFAAVEDPGGLKFEIVPLQPGVTCNVPTGVWHGIAMTPDDHVMIVEKSRTHLTDVEYRELGRQEYDELQSLLLGKGATTREDDEPIGALHDGTQGGLADRIPVVPQTFLFSMETAGIRIGETVRNARKMVEAQIACQERYGYDGCVIDFDDATLAEACGAKVIYRDDDPAIVDESDLAVKDLRAVDDLELPDPCSSGRLPVWLEATRRLVERIGDHVFVMGRADQGPFSLACLLRGPQQMMMDLMDEANHPQIDRLIDYCRRACALFAKAQKDAGAHATSIGDAFAGPSLISPEMFRRFALEPEALLVREVQQYGIPMSVHICGKTNKIIADMGSTEARILEVDWQLDMAAARRAVPASTVLMGNINPSDPLVLGTPGQVEKAACDVIRATGGRGLILSSGCAMGRNTPPENMQAMVAAAAKHGTYDQLAYNSVSRT